MEERNYRDRLGQSRETGDAGERANLRNEGKDHLRGRDGRWTEEGDRQRNTYDNRYGSEDRGQRGEYAGGAYSGSYGAGYPQSSQTGDYFGPGDYGSGSQAWNTNRDRSYGASRSPYGASGSGYSAGQTSQRDTRSWGDRQMGSYQPGEGYARDYFGDDNQRGFIDRATDEVKSWWGDEDAARRREQDHAGKGPSDYTRSDERIREDANDRLTEDWRVDARSVTVAVEKGEVTLSGTVPSRQEKHRAEETVERISGVKHVQNNLRVTSASTASTAMGGEAAMRSGSGLAGTNASTTNGSSASDVRK